MESKDKKDIYKFDPNVKKENLFLVGNNFVSITKPVLEIKEIGFDYGEVQATINTIHGIIKVKHDDNVKRFYSSEGDYWVDMPRSFYYKVIEAMEAFWDSL
ncbi:MAG: hypothetical protein ACRCRT_00355 [Cetobacterium somerae]